MFILLLKINPLKHHSFKEEILSQKQNQMVVVKICGVEELGDVGQRIQSFSRQEEKVQEIYCTSW